MKKTFIIRGLLLLFLSFQFLSCEDEPLVGDFPEGEGQGGAEVGQFKASIAGQEFIAESIVAVLNDANKLEITGAKSNGESISLSVGDAGVGTFNLNWDGVGPNRGTYIDGYPNTFPYISIADAGGSGLMKITELNTVAKTVTGTFSFTGVRIKVDGTGNPVLDGNGMPVMENIQINDGAFNSIPYLGEGSGDGDGDGDGDSDTQNEFLAKVDGVDFVADSISVSEPINGNIHMIKIEARSASRELIRIDIPRSLGVGTFDMESMSDGTKLIGLYRNNTGGENLTSNPGTITISEFDLVTGVLKATFKFTGKAPLGGDPTIVEITQGSFTVYFEGIPGANNRFRANIDGTEYLPGTVDVLNSVVNQYPRITLTTEVGNQRMELSFPATITVGTFDMGPEVNTGNEIVAIYTPIVGTSISYMSESGSIVITSYDFQAGVIEGTFNFTAADTVGQDPTIYQVTGGEFMAILQ